MFVRILFVLLLVAPAAVANETNSTVTLDGLLSYSMPKFPPELRGVMVGDGEVVIAVTIDDQGKVKDSAVLLATNEDFSESARVAVSSWEFAPAVGETWPRREVLQFNFKRSGVVTSMSHEEAAREGFAYTTAYTQIKTLQLNELDGEPQRLAGKMPSISRSILETLDDRPILVNFVIDSKGEVRVPVVYGSANKELAQLVLDAMKTWRYTPPLQKNKPVSTEITRALVFND